MMPFLCIFDCRICIIVELSFQFLKISNKFVERLVLFRVDLLPELLELFLCTLLVNLCPFIVVFTSEFCEVLVNSTLKLLNQVWMALVSIHGPFFEFSHHILSDLLFLHLKIFWLDRIFH